MVKDTIQRYAEGVVVEITSERAGAQEIQVRVSGLDADRAADDGGRLRSAINFLALNPRVRISETVLLNTCAVEMGLGTGGVDFVVCRLSEPAAFEAPAGHIMKLRYTPLQHPVLSVEAPESPHHETMRSFEGLEECPVICAELHSQLPAVCCGVRWGLREAGRKSDARIVYVMTEGAALPIGLSRLLPRLKTLGMLQSTVTAGQAFGGDYEAVNLYSALAAARAVGEADVIVVGQGPGNVGTQTPLGFSGIEQGQAINAATSLGGIPIIAPRISFADPRDRHQGISHHTLMVLQRVALAPALIPLPKLPGEQLAAIRATLDAAGIEDLHQTVVVSADRAYEELRKLDLNLTTMGRNIEQERPFFLAALAAGVLAAQVVEARTDE